MEMGTDKKIDPISLEGEIYTCPSCGYTDGFHVSFKMESGTNNAEVYLICPNCHKRFKPGWQVTLNASDA